LKGDVRIDDQRLDIPTAPVADGARIQIGPASPIAMPVIEQLVIERYARR
jgi:hypothetical protein